MKKLLIILAFILFFASCGGTYENDNSTWEKVFGEEKPNDVVLKNSFFWKSSHWTYEFEVFLEIEYNQKWLQKIVDEFQFELYEKSDAFSVCYVNDKQKWFIPKTEDNYICLISKKHSEAKIFVDKKTNVIYFTFNQL